MSGRINNYLLEFVLDCIFYVSTVYTINFTVKGSSMTLYTMSAV